MQSIIPTPKATRLSLPVGRNRFLRVRAEKKGGFFSSLFSKVLDPEDPAPAGLKRMTEEEQPEVWGVADSGVWADKVEGDEGLVEIIRPLLAKTQLEKVPLRLAYDANRDGWTGPAFHKAVDTFGACIIVARLDNGAIVGGYNPRGFINLGEDRDSPAAFLFSWPDGDVSQLPLKLPKVGGPAQAVLDKTDQGIFFGPEGLTIALDRANPKEVKSRLGSYYQNTEDGSTLFPSTATSRGKIKTAKGQLTELYAFVAEGEGEKWDLNGVVWETKK